MEERIERLEKLFNALLKRIDKDKFYNQADKGGIRQTVDIGFDEIKAIDGNAWNADKVYYDGDTVIYGNSFARCLHTNKGIVPTNKVYWELLNVSDMILDLMERVSALEQEE